MSDSDVKEFVVRAFRLREVEYNSIRAIVAYKDILMREFYASAFVDMVERRRAWKAQQPFDRFPWRVLPAGGKRVVSQSRFEEVVELERYAELDDVRIGNVIYTATYHKLVELAGSTNLTTVLGDSK